MVNDLIRWIIIGFRAIFLNYPYWRVEYNDGGITKLLYFSEAFDLRIQNGGQLFIDFEIQF